MRHWNRLQKEDLLLLGTIYQSEYMTISTLNFGGQTMYSDDSISVVSVSRSWHV